MQRPANAKVKQTETERLWLCRAPLKDLSQEDRESRATSLFSEFLSSNDYAEATACVQELTAPGKLSAGVAWLSVDCQQHWWLPGALG